MRRNPRILWDIKRGEGGFSFAELVVGIALFVSAVLGMGSLLISGGTLVGSSAKANTAMRLASAKMEQVKSLSFYVAWRGTNADIDDTYWRWTDPAGTGTPLTNAQQLTQTWRTGEKGYETYGSINGFAGYKRTTTVQYFYLDPSDTLVAAFMNRNWVPSNPNNPNIPVGKVDRPQGGPEDTSDEYLHMLTVEVKVSYMDKGIERTYTERGLASDLLSSGETLNSGMVVESIQAVDPDRQPAWGYRGYQGEDIVCDVSIDAPEMTADDAVTISLWLAGQNDVVGANVQHVTGQPAADRRVTFHVGACGSYPAGWYNLSVSWVRKQIRDDNLRNCFEFRDKTLAIDTVASMFGPEAITGFAVTPGSGPSGITVGPDGNLWFTENNAIGCMSTDGVIIGTYSVTAGRSPSRITVGSDGNLWFTEPSTNTIGCMSTAGGLVGEFAVTAGSTPSEITAGPDGNLWFIENGTGKIGCMSTAGVLIGEFAIPTASSDPRGITVGSDENLWFTENNAIGCMSTDGVLIGTFPVTPGRSPSRITVGSDGNLWFTEPSTNTIGCMGTDGALIGDSYSVTAGSSPSEITAGPDDNLWFIEHATNKIGCMSTTADLIGEFAIPTASSDPRGITATAGPDGALWFTELSANKIGRLIPGGTEGKAEGTLAWGYQAQTARKLSITGTNFGSGTGGLQAPIVTMTGKDLLNKVYTLTATKVAMGADGTTLIATFDFKSNKPTGGWPAEMMWDLKVNRDGQVTTEPGSFTLNPKPSVDSVDGKGTQMPENISYTYVAYNNNDFINVKVTGAYLYGLADYVNGVKGKGIELADIQPDPELNPTNYTYYCRSKTPVAASSETESGYNDCKGTDNWAILTFDPSLGTPFKANGRACVVVRNLGGTCYTDPGDNTQYVWMNPREITEFPLADANRNPMDITQGPYGNLWFTENGKDKIGCMDVNGNLIGEYPLASGSSPWGITAGPDGNIWFAEAGTNKIGCMDINGNLIREISLASNSHPYDITVGPGPGGTSMLWFTENGTDKIGRMTTAGVFTVHDECTLASGSSPWGITLGPDGNIWFTENGKNKIGRINPATTNLDTYTAPEYPTYSAQSKPYDITVGPGPGGTTMLWFTENNKDKIGRMTTAGVSTVHDECTLASNSSPWGIALGLDGNIWFTENGRNNIGRINPATTNLDTYTCTEYPMFNSGSNPHGITAGPDGNIWFTEFGAMPDQIGVFDLSFVMP